MNKIMQPKEKISYENKLQTNGCNIIETQLLRKCSVKDFYNHLPYNKETKRMTSSIVF